MNRDDVIRVFIAVEISEGVRGELQAVQDELRKVGGRISWVKPENIHLTFAFLGDTFRERVDKLNGLLNEVSAQVVPFEMRVNGIGAFGSKRSPRIIWAGVDASEDVMELQRKVTDCIRAVDVPVESRSYHPHITLGRVRSGSWGDSLTSALTSYKNISFGSVNVHRVLLMQSHLEHQGVRYTILSESMLKGA